MIAIERFGARRRPSDIFEAFGFTPEHVADVARGVLTGDLRASISPPPDHEAPDASDGTSHWRPSR